MAIIVFHHFLSSHGCLRPISTADQDTICDSLDICTNWVFDGILTTTSLYWKFPYCFDIRIALNWFMIDKTRYLYIFEYLWKNLINKVKFEAKHREWNRPVRSVTTKFLLVDIARHKFDVSTSTFNILLNLYWVLNDQGPVLADIAKCLASVVVCIPEKMVAEKMIKTRKIRVIPFML